ncbi:MAG: hypothetical protein IJA69_01050 [Clostridia bacterium]|nr:hypothetical protein [Clostridia bacterium]
MKKITEVIEFELQEKNKLEEVVKKLEICELKVDAFEKTKQELIKQKKAIKKDKIMTVVGTLAMGALTATTFALGIASVGLASALLCGSFGGFMAATFAKSANIDSLIASIDASNEQMNKYISFLNSERVWAQSNLDEIQKLQQKSHIMSAEEYNVEFVQIKSQRAVASRGVLLGNMRKLYDEITQNIENIEGKIVEDKGEENEK